MPRFDLVASTGAWLLENAHRALSAVTGGRWPRRLAGMPTLQLHVVGRTSGQKHSTLLTSPLCENDRVVLVASKAGHSEHPQWYENLLVNPDVEITLGDRTRAMQARTASPREREELWARITREFPRYAGYQSRTDREIPVVICEPV